MIKSKKYYVRSISEIWSTSDLNFFLAKVLIWSTPDFHFSQQSCKIKIWSTPDL